MCFVSSLQISCLWGDQCLEITKLLLESGAAINCPTEHDNTPLYTPLYMAANLTARETTETMKFLIEQGGRSRLRVSCT